MEILIILGTLAVIAGVQSAIPDHATTTRPPAFPLAVRNPYTNFWLSKNELPGNWPNFWTGSVKAWTGLVRVDGETYVWMGNPRNAGGQLVGTLATQTWTAITPTQTHFGIRAGAVNITATFFSPVEYEDIMRQSIPLSYVDVTVNVNDGGTHQVQLYMDISGEWAANDVAKKIVWGPSSTPSGLKVWTSELDAPNKFVEWGEYAEWGQALIATSSLASHQSGADVDVRTAFQSSGSLPNTHDDNYRCASCDWPVFGFAHDLSELNADSEVTTSYIVGLVREDNANFLGEAQHALWVEYWPSTGELVDFFWEDRLESLEKANALDIKILNDAFQAGGQYYADILTLSLRQSYATNEFSGTKENPIYYQKEISSGAFMQTVDVIYPATPMFYYLNITYLKLLLDPLFYQMEEGVWTKPFAMHDIGVPYPNAMGQGYGGDMPVEESGNMLMMVADIIFHPTTTRDEGVEYATKHYPVMQQWADYLYHNCLYPVNQLSTDDFIGPTELNSGLALKGILGMAAFAKIADFLDDKQTGDYYHAAVANFTPIWLMESMHNDKTHLKMEYNVTDGYQFKYNAFHDKLLGLNVVPQEIYELEANYYMTKLEPYGIPFVSTHDYTKSDWEMWTAAAFGDVNPGLKSSLIEALGKMLRFTASRVPFSDWYVTATANQVGFQARPVVGGHFALLALEVAKGK